LATRHSLQFFKFVVRLSTMYQEKKILFVCLGNICRSPMAEAIFNKLAEDRSLHHVFKCTSAGTAGYHIGELPDYRTRMVCEMNAVTLNHRGRKIGHDDLAEFDLILAMDSSNVRDIIHLLKVKEEHSDKIRLLRSFEPDGEGKEVPDPYYGNLDDFKNVYEMLLKSCGHLLDELTSTN